MTAALRALMTGVIDFAGLFPPAKLSMEDAVHEFMEIHESIDDAWMLRSFVVPSSRLPELERWGKVLRRSDHPVSLTLTGRPAENSEQWREHLAADLEVAKTFNKFCGERIIIKSLELPLPGDIGGDRTDFSPYFDVRAVGFAGFLKHLATICVEVPANPGADAVRRALIRQLGSPVKRTGIELACDRPVVGFKFRTGGLTADGFPSDEQLADVIYECATHNCPWKATAGLHHAMRYDDSEIGAKTHGFLNVLFANAFARINLISKDEILDIVANEDPGRFEIDEYGIRWNGRTIPIHMLPASRFNGFASFGSCSFAEPRDDLKSLGLL